MRRPLLLLALPPLLAGCFLFESKQTRALRASPDYRAGYSDGCASAGSVSANPRADSRRRDDQAYAGNAAYRLGWGEGYGACRPMPTISPNGGADLPHY
ncbi:MAG: hypothetical protein JO256_08135 [Alphaproteobacteria bacterium]|nr:hypothetical protein [Alphaproteobacteria bacterium]